MGLVALVDPAGSSALFASIYGLSFGSVKARPAVFFRRFTSSFQVGAEGNQRMTITYGFFSVSH